VCTTDTCDLTSNTCVHTPNPACCTGAADCNDGNPCTTDGCGAVTGYGATRSVTCCLVRLQARIIDLADHQPDAVSVSTDTQDGAL